MGFFDKLKNGLTKTVNQSQNKLIMYSVCS